MLTLSQWLVRAIPILLLSLLLVVSFFREEKRVNPRWRYYISLTAFIWAIAQGIYIVSKLAYIFSESPIVILGDSQIVRSFLIQVRMGQMLLIQMTIGFIISILAQLITSSRAFKLLLLFTAVSLTPPALTGHAGSESYHWIAVSSWAVHILSISIWSAAVCALLIIRFTTSGEVRRYFESISQLSFFAFFAVLASGVINSWVRIPSLGSILESRYGQLVLIKISLLLMLSLFGLWYRTRAIPNHLDGSSVFLRTLSLEIFLLGTAIMLGVVLSSTKLPISLPG